MRAQRIAATLAELNDIFSDAVTGINLFKSKGVDLIACNWFIVSDVFKTCFISKQSLTAFILFFIFEKTN